MAVDTEKEAADCVHRLVQQLNDALALCQQRGLRVELDVLIRRELGKTDGLLVQKRIYKEF